MINAYFFKCKKTIEERKLKDYLVNTIRCRGTRSVVLFDSLLYMDYGQVCFLVDIQTGIRNLLRLCFTDISESALRC